MRWYSTSIWPIGITDQIESADAMFKVILELFNVSTLSFKVYWALTRSLSCPPLSQALRPLPTPLYLIPVNVYQAQFVRISHHLTWSRTVLHLVSTNAPVLNSIDMGMVLSRWPKNHFKSVRGDELERGSRHYMKKARRSLRLAAYAKKVLYILAGARSRRPSERLKESLPARALSSYQSIHLFRLWPRTFAVCNPSTRGRKWHICVFYIHVIWNIYHQWEMHSLRNLYRDNNSCR
jgi:hypothetical protein